MDKVFEQIGNIDSLYKLSALVIACLMFITWSKWDTVSKWISFLFNYVFKIKKQEKEKVLKDLLGHSIFYRCEDIRQEVKEMEFTTHEKVDFKKTVLLHTLIDCQLDVIKEKLRDVLSNEENNNLSIEGMQNVCMKLKNDITNFYCARAKSLFVHKHGISELDAEFLLDSYTRYRRNFNGHFEVQMMGIINNSTYDTNHKKVSVLLEVISMSLYSIPTQSKGAMDTVNGRFKKYN